MDIKDVFINPDAYQSFKVFVGQILGISTDESTLLFSQFIDSLVDFDSSGIREEICFAVRKVFDPSLERYENEDIIAWISPYPKSSIKKLAKHCVSRICDLEIVTPNWEMSEQKLSILEAEIISRLVKRVTKSDSWSLAASLKKELGLDNSLKTLVNFIEERRRPREDLNRKILKKQIKTEFKK